MKKLSVEALVLLPQRTFRSQATDPSVVAEYEGLMLQGVEFPPLTIAVFGKKEILVGGAHRLAAAVKAKLTELPVNHVGCKSAVDVDVLSFTDNASHGLNLSAEDRRKAIIALIQQPSFKKLSNANIAKRLSVSDMTIKRYRDSIGTTSPKAAQSGHKSKGAIEKGVKVDKGGKVEAVPVKGKPASAWSMTGGSWSGGGIDAIVESITVRVTEGVGRKSTASWNERCEYLEQLGTKLVAWAQANKAQ